MGGQGGAGGHGVGAGRGWGSRCGGDREGLVALFWGDRADCLDGQLGEGLWKADVSRDKGISSRSGR